MKIIKHGDPTRRELFGYCGCGCEFEVDVYERIIVCRDGGQRLSAACPDCMKTVVLGYQRSKQAIENANAQHEFLKAIEGDMVEGWRKP